MESSDFVKKRPVLVVPFSLIFGAINIQGESIISQEIYDIMVLLRKRGYYILVDCFKDLEASSHALNFSGIPFDGLTFDKHSGAIHDEERYAERVDFHCGWDTVAVVIDEDIVRLNLAVNLGAIAIQVQSGCVISQTASGCAKVEASLPKPVYAASMRD